MGRITMHNKLHAIICVILLAHLAVQGQDNTYTSEWDNQLFAGNKLVWGSGKWKYSGEFQVRIDDNFSSLERWFIEGMSSYMPTKNWEIVPDLRFSVKSNSQEIRPGLGGLFKILTSKLQYVNQVKWQADYNTRGTLSHGVRWINFLNYILSDMFVPNIVGGVFYSWKEQFIGWEYIRFGAGVNIRFDPIHTLNLTYFTGAANTGRSWTWSGIFFAQLTIKITDDWIYVPAKFINF
jgi:hypothetical protein